MAKPAGTRNEHGLTPAEEAFCSRYIVNGSNQQEAAAFAGIGRTPASSQVLSGKLMKQPHILARIRALSAKATEKAGMKSEEVLTRLSNVGRVNPKDLFDAKGRLKSLHDLPDEVAECIASMEVVTKEIKEKGEVVDVEYIHKIKFWDKLKGLELLGKTHSLFIDRIEQTHKHELADLDDDAIAGIIQGLAAQASVGDLLARIGQASKHEKDPVDVPGPGAASS